MSILIYADHNNVQLHGSLRNTITAATQIGGDVHVLIAGHNCAGIANEAAQIAGVKEVLFADDATLANHLAENATALVMSIAKNYTHILAAATTVGKYILPRVAALLDVAQISEISGVISSDTFERPIYAGNADATVKSNDEIRVITVRATKFEAAVKNESAAPIKSISVGSDTGLATFVNNETTKLERPELTSASIIVSGGRGVGSEEGFKLLYPLADKLKAAVGASRAAVDAGYAPSDYQVGQTGKIVAPEVYIAVGISGAIQHLAGMKDSKLIVAINKDPDAPIFQVADVGLVGDLFQIIPELVAALPDSK
jgi:electron transfer flavoprotein alpha subunit